MASSFLAYEQLRTFFSNMIYRATEIKTETPYESCCEIFKDNDTKLYDALCICNRNISGKLYSSNF